MWILMRMAFRNIFRFKRRTLITFSAISIGLALLIIIISLLNGVDKQSIRNIIDCQTSHLKVFKKGYFEKREKFPMGFTIKNPAPIKELLKKIPHVVAVESRILFAVGLIKGMDELPCMGVAIETEQDAKLFNLKESLVSGSWLEPGETKMVLGQNLAEDMNLAVGDIVTARLIVTSVEEGFNWNAIDLEVKGIFNSGEPAVDSSRIFLPMAVAAEGLSSGKEVTEIVIRLDSDRDDVVSATRARVKTILSQQKEELEVYSWKDLAGTFLLISQMKSQRSSMIILIMLFIATIGIVNTMLMAVMERTREIGMMSALGMKKHEVMALFIFEGGFIGVIGSLLGCLLGGIAAWYLEVYGWSIASLGPSVQKITSTFYPVKDVFYADFTWGLLLMVFTFGTVLSMLASLYPARKAAHLDPVDALRHI